MPVITNIDAEHLDFYGTHERVKTAFVEFAERVPFYGLSVLCLDHPHVQDILPRIRHRHVTYGLSPQADYCARNVRQAGLTTSFMVHRKGEPLGEFSVRMPGEHNVLNTMATIAVADELEVPLDVMKSALKSFHGVARRFTVTHEIGGVTLVDDYGHHPAEVIATLDAARKVFNQRVLVAFQPHRYSRTQHSFDDFTRAFNVADSVIIADIYAAGEQPIAGISSEALVKAMHDHGHHSVRHIPDRRAIAEALVAEARPGDVVVALGAGDINKILPLVAEGLRARFGGGNQP